MNEPTTRLRVGAQAAAQHLGVTLRELKELRRLRKIAFYRIGHRTVSYSIADLNTFLTTCRVAPAGEGIGARHETSDYRPQTHDRRHGVRA